MKLIISVFLVLLLQCNWNKNNSSKENIPDKKETDVLLLKVLWFKGEIEIVRDKEKLTPSESLELEKEDIIKTGQNGEIELLLGFNHNIKLTQNSEVSITNLLTTEEKTAVHISLSHGKMLTSILKEDPEYLVTVTTPLTQVNLQEGTLLTQTFNQNSNQINCPKESCKIIFQMLDGSAELKQFGKNTSIVLKEKHQVSLSNEKEFTENDLIPIQNNSEIYYMIQFHSVENFISENLLAEYKIPSRIVSKEKIIIPKKLEVKKKTKIIQNNTKSIKPIKTNLYKDKLKLDSNNKF